MFERLVKLIKDAMPDIDVSNVNPETKLFDDLHFDSLALMMLSMNIEDEFGITFNEPVIFNTVQEVIDYLEKNTK